MMVVLDFSIVNVALPSIQRDLAFAALAAVAFVVGMVFVESRHADRAHARLRDRRSAELA